MASRYFVAGPAGNNNYSQSGSGSNWALTDGGAGGQTVPASTDDVFFTANSPACIVDSSPKTCLSLNCTGYANQLTMTNGITALGNVTLSSSMTVSGTGSLIVQSNPATLTSNGFTWPNDLTLSSSVTHTLADNWSVSGRIILANGSVAMILNGNSFNCLGGLRLNVSTGNISGTTIFKLAATQTVDAPSVTTGRLLSPVTIDTTGTITFTSPIPIDVGLLTYIKGTVITNNTWSSGSSGAPSFGAGSLFRGAA